MMILSSKYIDDEYKENLKHYKFTGKDNSIYYNYVISPICNVITNYIPKWIVPNTVTVIGWVLNVISLILTIVYGGWKGCNYFPSWVCYYSSISYSAYIYLDAIDGKQARRLNASSPLGVLFDHGSDACTSFMISIITGSFFYFNNVLQYLLIFFPLTFTFFMNFIEEYYTGVLDLPVINGVEEGSIYVSLTMFLSGYFGPEIFEKKINIFSFQIKFSELNAALVFIGASLHCLKCVYDIMVKIERGKICQFLKNCFFFIFFSLSLISVIFLNDSIIVKEYPKLFLMIYGIEIAKVYGIIQVSQLIGSPLRIYRKVFVIPLLVLLIHSCVFYLIKPFAIVSVDVLLIFFLFWNFLSWLHYVYFCSEECCDILNIKRFSLGKRYHNRLSFGEEMKIRKI